MGDFSRIIASKPVNATTAKVVSRGIDWVPDKVKRAKQWQERTDAPLPTREFIGPQDQDITGKRYGRLTVVGNSAERSRNDRGAAWVVRCTCGYYEIRRTKTLNEQAGRSAQMCSHCDILEAIKNGEPQSK